MSFSKFPIGYANLISIIASPPVGKLRCLLDWTPSSETTKVFVDFLYFGLSFWISINRFLLKNVWNMLATVIRIFCSSDFDVPIYFSKAELWGFLFRCRQIKRMCNLSVHPMVSLSRIFGIGLSLLLILTW